MEHVEVEVVISATRLAVVVLVLVQEAPVRQIAQLEAEPVGTSRPVMFAKGLEIGAENNAVMMKAEHLFRGIRHVVQGMTVPVSMARRRV